MKYLLLRLDMPKYSENERVLEKRASVPSQDYARFCEGLESLKHFLNLQG